MMLEAEHISVSYGSAHILRDVSFRLEEGRWLMVIGPNGAGKSTLVNALSRGCSFTGRVLFNGTDLARMKPREIAHHLGVLDQSHNVGYAFTVEEVVRLGRYAYTGAFKGGTGREEEIIEEALRLTGLEKLRHHSVLTLSGGELQRTFLAQLFAQDPEVLILDEPTNHLDLLYQKEVFSLVSGWLKRPGRAVLSVVHDLSLAKAYGTDALLLKDGKVLASGTMDECVTPARLAEAYDMDVYSWMRSLLGQWQEP